MALDQWIRAQADPECIAIDVVDGVSVALKCVQTCQTVQSNTSGAGYSQNVACSQMRWDLPSISQNSAPGFTGFLYLVQ